MKDIVVYGAEAVCGTVVVCLGASFRCLAKKVHRQMDDQKALRDGTLALLRSELIRVYDKYILRKHIPIYAMENVLALYSAYHALGGNGTITKLIDELNELPSNCGGDDGYGVGDKN